MNPRFFGNSKQPLFGIYHPPRGRKPDTRAVVICPSIGHEYIRSHWALRTLATKLARAGCGVFRFDYRGTGDSSGDVSDVLSVREWVEDACEAGVELLEECGQNRAVTFVGFRFGASIACMAAKELAESNSVATELVLWEPSLVGANYLSELRSMHNEMLDLWASPVETEDSTEFEELLGFRYQRGLIDELESTDLLHDSQPSAEQIAVFNSRETIDLSPWESNASTHSTGDGYDWDDLRYIAEAWLPGNGLSLVCDAITKTAASEKKPENRIPSGVGSPVS